MDSNVQAPLGKDDVISSIRMESRHQSAKKKVWVIVEGVTDQGLFQNLLNDHVQIEISRAGLRGVLDIVAALLPETNRVIGIRDADFLHLEGREEKSKHIFVTDCHDAEMMIVSCERAYHQVAGAYLGKEKRQTVTREKILASIAFIGGLRWLNHTDDLKLNFDRLGLGKFYKPETLSIDEAGLLAVILERSKKGPETVSKENVAAKIADVSDYLNLCNGHDFQWAFASLTNTEKKKKAEKEKRKGKGIGTDEIGRAFRVAYRPEDFRKTNLYGTLKAWADGQSLTLFSGG